MTPPSTTTSEDRRTAKSAVDRIMANRYVREADMWHREVRRRPPGGTAPT